MLFIAITTAAWGGIASRYADLFSLGVLTNLLCIMTSSVHGRKLIALSAAGGIWSLVVVQGLWRQEELAHSITLSQQLALQEKTAADIRQFIMHGDTGALRQNEQLSPLDIGVIENVRRTPELREILPFSIRAPLESGSSGSEAGFNINGIPVVQGAAPDLPVVGSWTPHERSTAVRWESAPLTSKAALLAFFVAGEINPPATNLFFETADGEKTTSLQGITVSHERWRRVNFPNPRGEFRIVATDDDPNHWLAFSAPVELARGSWLTAKIIRIGPWLVFSGWTLLIGALLVIFAKWISPL